MKMRIHRGALVVAAVAALVGFPLFSGLALAATTSMRLKPWNMPRKPWHMANRGMPMSWCSMLKKHSSMPGRPGRIRMWMKGSSISRKPLPMARQVMPMWQHNMPKRQSPICPK